MKIPSDSAVIVSKLDAAKLQLDAAIDAYIAGKMILAITLAAAAEEIFGNILSREGQSNAIEELSELEPLSRIFPCEKKRIEFLNNVRNNLKHAHSSNEDSFVVSEFDGYFMIVRALINAKKLNVEDTSIMNDFRIKFLNISC